MDIIPILDALLRAMPEDMINQYESHRQELEATLAQMAKSDSNSSSSGTLNYVVNTMRKMSTTSAGLSSKTDMPLSSVLSRESRRATTATTLPVEVGDTETECVSKN